jgi:hypothetical protein
VRDSVLLGAKLRLLLVSRVASGFFLDTSIVSLLILDGAGSVGGLGWGVFAALDALKRVIVIGPEFALSLARATVGCLTAGFCV